MRAWMRRWLGGGGRPAHGGAGSREGAARAEAATAAVRLDELLELRRRVREGEGLARGILAELGRGRDRATLAEVRRRCGAYLEDGGGSACEHAPQDGGEG